MVEGARLESVYVERHRGFESLSHRQFLSQILSRDQGRLLFAYALVVQLIPAPLHSGGPFAGRRRASV